MIELKTLPTQIHVGKRPLKYRFQNARNYGETERSGYMKPVGGMWTSTWETAFDIGWPSWVLGEDWRTEQLQEAWLLEPVECRVIELANFRQVHEFMQHYAEPLYYLEGLSDRPYYEDIDGVLKEELVGTHTMCPVWERVAKDADAVRLVAPYEFNVRLGPYIAFYGWDCESTIWLRWKFKGAARKIDLSEHLESQKSEIGKE